MYTSHHPCWDAKNRFGLLDKLPFDFAQVAHCFVMPEAPEMDYTAPSVTSPPTVNPTMNVTTSIRQTSHSEADTLLPGGIPKDLWDLMQHNAVTENQIRKVVNMRGYYPEDTPISNYDPAFVAGVLVGAWQQVYQMIKENDL